MPNARDVSVETAHRILMLGATGSGKTTQFLTLPGRKFLYIFDPNAIRSIQGNDVEYQEFLPDTLNLNISSLKKGVGDTIGKVKPADVYLDWERDFEERLSSEYFKDFDWIGLDSFTTFSDMVMDRVLTINGRTGQWPQQDDYGPQMNTLTNVIRTLTGTGKGLYVTAHVEVIKNELTGQVFNQPVMTGRLRVKLPLLFSEIFFCEAENDGKGKIGYNLQTKPSRMMPLIRCTIKGLDDKNQVVSLEPFEDVTLNFNEPLEGQGLGGILNWERRFLQRSK
jgi:hypothetical protein